MKTSSINELYEKVRKSPFRKMLLSDALAQFDGIPVGCIKKGEKSNISYVSECILDHILYFDLLFNWIILVVCYD